MSLSEVQERVVQLESAIKRLDIVKKHLNRNASDVKAEIHASVSRNLECLRNREVTLLRQVDQVLRVKEETLQKQQARLNQTLGVLRTGLSMILEHTASERQLTETLEKLNRIELSPEETPYISFRADHVKLRESILHYGRVDASGLPPLMAFNDPGNPSASLPRRVEEYQDVDHHIFYKTLERQTSASGVRRINVAIPKLSTHLEDWLQKKTPAIKTKTEVKAPDRRQPATRPNLLNKSGDLPVIGVSDSSTPGSSCSLNSWLSLIKQHADLEEEHDFEIVDNSCLHKAEIRSPFASTEASPACFQAIKKDLRSWLFSGSQCGAQFSSTFFSHLPSDSKFWLPKTCQQETNLDDLKHQDFFKDISSELSTWLHSQAECQQLAAHDGGDSHDMATQDKEECLQAQNKAFQAEIEHESVQSDRASRTNRSGCSSSSCTSEDEGKWLLCSVASDPSFQLEDICQSSDVCFKASKCNSQPDCFRPCFKDKSPVGAVVDPALSFRPASVASSSWPSLTVSQKLVKCSSTTVAEKKGLDLFSHIPSAGNSMWLMKSNTQSSPELGKNQCPSDNSKDDKPETSLWLQKKGCISAVDLASSAWAKSGSVSTDFCISDWLMVPVKVKGGCSEEVDQNKNESEG
ncbi:unnamed protein product [Candidula unifasciata]|uniref:Nuclear receptor coactivator 4 N-terminal domain-containing protein n=1 Tax=Candidula unifasciata TaxID=100452 RepID=A0A8S3ZUU6_9EUPU|nr:unnamed protein product [Candidula unifasciata]